MRKFLFVLATLAIAITPVSGQTKAEPGAPKEAPKPLVITVSQTQPPLLAEVLLDEVSEHTLPRGAAFPERLSFVEATSESGARFENQALEANEPLAETIKVRGLKKLPIKTVPMKGLIVTLAPGAKWPEQPKAPAPAKEPERIQVGLRNVTKAQLASDNNLMAQAIMDLRRDVKKLGDRVTAAEKAALLTGKPTGEYYWSCSNLVVSVDGRVVRLEGWDSERRCYRYQYVK